MSELDDDNIEAQLLHASDHDPAEALDWISRLTEHDLPTHPLILFCKFNALRHLATDRLYTDGRTSVHGMRLQEIEPLFGPEQIDWAREALTTIAKLEEVDPDYLNKHQFVYDFIDRVCAPLERVQPGAVQELLGWTRLGHFGFDRIRFYGDLIHQIPQDFMRNALKARISIPDRVTTAIVYTFAEEPDGREVEIMLLRRDPQEGEVVGNVQEGTLRICESGAWEYTREKPDMSADQDGLEHPNREYLLQESEMLLKYENDSDKRAFLRQTIEWLNGRAERPVFPS